MIIYRIKENWFIGKAGKLVFFAQNEICLMRKYRAHLERNQPKPIDPERVAAKIIRFEDYFKPTYPGAA